jgi:hypothetical protein
MGEVMPDGRNAFGLHPLITMAIDHRRFSFRVRQGI